MSAAVGGRGVVWAALLALVGCAGRGAPATRLPVTASLGEGILEVSRAGPMLEVRTTDPRGLVHVYVRAGDRLHVLHASASIGSAEYRRVGGAWQRVRDFDWSCRAPEPAGCRDAFLERERWDANPVPPAQPAARRFRVELGAFAHGGSVDVPVARYVYPGDIVTWPATVRDGARDEGLLRGVAPPTLTLDLARWAHLPGRPEQDRSLEGNGGRARESKACPKAAFSGGSSPVLPGVPGVLSAGSAADPSAVATLPDPLPDFIVAASQLAAAAVARGDRAEARRLLESALQAVEDGGAASPVLRIVTPGDRG